jgi:hypothetical protein
MLRRQDTFIIIIIIIIIIFVLRFVFHTHDVRLSQHLPAELGTVVI